MTRDPWDTPAMRQYVRFKKDHPGCLLFFRMGDFYEMFGEDAETLAPALGLRLSKRGSPIPMAGVPHHQKDVYLRRAVDLGFRIAVCDQVQDPKDAKGVVDRAVTRVVTPGTLLGDDTDERTSALGAVWFGDGGHSAAACMIELGSGRVRLAQGDPARVTDELGASGVRELLYCEVATGGLPDRVAAMVEALGAHPTARPAWQFRAEESLEAIRETYGVSGVGGFGLADDASAIAPLGAALRYLAETQGVGAPGLPGAPRPSLQHLRSPALAEQDDRVCRLDAPTRRALEIEQTVRDQQTRGSLLGIFLHAGAGAGRPRTPMGRRTLRDWLRHPLARVEDITARQRMVRGLARDRTLAGSLGDTLDGLLDLNRILGRLALARISPPDLVALASAVRRAPEALQLLDGSDAFHDLRASLARALAGAGTLGQEIDAACVEDPPAKLTDGGLFRDGVDAELDRARGLSRDAGAWLADFQAKAAEAHDLPSIKAGFNKVFGYYLELPTAQARRAPGSFERVQTLKNAERYTTPELREFERRVTSADSDAADRERLLLQQLLTRAIDTLEPLHRLGDALGELDAVLCLADKAAHRGWVEPEIVQTPTLDIHAGRHPVLDESIDGRFVPNDTRLGVDDSPARLALITGPNMAGKSTHIRQAALLALLSMTGSFIPADRATVGVADRVFTRVGADDALHRGQSTFMVEMTETAVILNHATERSLVILDEIGRGTSTLDGLSLARAIAESLAALGARTLFATHYHEITRLAEHEPERVVNRHVAVREWTPEGRDHPEIAFLHEIHPGPTDRSYGVHVARLAGIPRAVTDRADEILRSLAVRDGKDIEPPPTCHSNGQPQLGLFTEFVPHPSVDRLRELKLESLSPLDAFDLLRELKAESEGGPVSPA